MSPLSLGMLATEEIKGVEVDLVFRSLKTGLSAPTTAISTRATTNFVADIDGGAEIELTDNSYLRPRNTPENTFGISTTYTVAVGPGNLQGALAYRYRDAIEVDLVSQVPTKPVSPVDSGGIGSMDSIYDLSAQLSYMFSDDRYRVTVYGKNLTDERELYNQTIGGIATRGYWNDPRTYGVEFAVSF